MDRISNKTIFYSLLFITLFFCTTSMSFAQQNTFKELENITYIAQNKSAIQNSTEYISAINSSDFNKHRLKSERNTITFEGGFSILLLSAEELIANGVNGINLLDFPSQIEDYVSPSFKLGQNNTILEPKQTIIPKQNFKIK